MDALRKANEKLQKLEEDQCDEQRLALQRDLDEALVHLEGLRAERRQQTYMVEALVKQKDLYKTIASHSTDPKSGATQTQRSPVALTSSPFGSSNQPNADKQNELKANLDKMTKEYEKYREESSDRMKALTETNEKLRQEISNPEDRIDERFFGIGFHRRETRNV